METIGFFEVRMGTGIGGKSFITMTGDVAAVTESVEIGALAGGESGLLLNKVVIPNPCEELFLNLF